MDLRNRLPGAVYRNPDWHSGAGYGVCPGPVGPGLCGASGCGCGYGDGGGLFCRNRISGCGCCEACSGTRRGSDALRQRLYLPGSRNFAVASPHVGDRKRRSGLLAGDQMALQKDFL